MKKSVVLLELIISILILSIIGIYSLLFINNLYKTNSQNLELVNSKLDLQITSVFIESLLKKSVDIKTSSNQINFYEINEKDFKENKYSGFTILEKSSKEYVYTPFSSISQTNSKFIWFTNEYIYEIKNSFVDDKIYFKYPLKNKRIFEQYKLLNQKSKIYLSNNILYLNNDILLNNIKSFNPSISNNNLKINICSEICQEWIINI